MSESAPAEVMDRIAAAFGNLPPAEETDAGQAEQVSAPADAEDAKAADDLFELDIDGEKYQVPAKLKEAFMRTDDYTRKTQELGTHRASC